MNPNESAQRTWPRWAPVLALLMASVLATADDTKSKKSTPSPNPTPSPTPRPTHGTPGKTPASPAPRAAESKPEHGATEHGGKAAEGAAADHGAGASGTRTEHRTSPASGSTPSHGSTASPGPGSTHGAASAHPGPAPTTREFKSAGQKVQASYRDGHVRTIEAPHMRIDRGLHGDRRIVTEQSGREIVVLGPHRGYTQRVYESRAGREYVQRTYFVGGRRYAYAYRTYDYGGVRYYGYAPAFYFRPVYYAWAYSPWSAPVSYRWGWGDEPWYGYYGSYFTPYRTYPTASAWLTDYVIADDLRAAYEARPSAAPSSEDAAPGGEPQLDPDVKQVIANEIKRQIAAEREAAVNQNGSPSDEDEPPALDPSGRVFVVASNLDTTTSTGQECELSPGDVLLRARDRVEDDERVRVTVASSKKDDCRAGASVSVDLGDLQEMSNHLRQAVDAGLKTLADNAGRNGLPAAPDTSTRGGEIPAPAADANVESDIQQQQSEADRLETEAPPQ